jgi:hypothetical protein
MRSVVAAATSVEPQRIDAHTAETGKLGAALARMSEQRRTPIHKARNHTAPPNASGTAWAIERTAAACARQVFGNCSSTRGVARSLTRLTTDDIHADTLRRDAAGMLLGRAHCMRDAHMYVQRQSAEQVVDRLERPTPAVLQPPLPERCFVASVVEHSNAGHCRFRRPNLPDESLAVAHDRGRRSRARESGSSCGTLSYSMIGTPAVTSAAAVRKLSAMRGNQILCNSPSAAAPPKRTTTLIVALPVAARRPTVRRRRRQKRPLDGARRRHAQLPTRGASSPILPAAAGLFVAGRYEAGNAFTGDVGAAATPQIRPRNH